MDRSGVTSESNWLRGEIARAADEYERTRLEYVERLEAEAERLRANLAAIRCEIDARRECAELQTIRYYADESTDMRPEALRSGTTALSADEESPT